MKIKYVVLIALCFMILFSQTATAEDMAWKEYLKDFLVNNFPSLFDEEVKKKNEELIEKYWGDIYTNRESVPLSEFSGDIEIYSDFVLPRKYYFYDLDYDGIPEVIIDYGGLASGMGLRYIYKLYGASYEQIGSLSGGEYYEEIYVNPLGKIVSVNTESTRILEIKNKEIVYSDYIDSFGSDSYNGVKYNEIGTYSNSEVFSFESYEVFLECEEFLADLRYIPEFDCSDILHSIKYGTPLNPKTGDNSLIYIAALITTCFALAKLKKFKRIKNV